VTGVFVMPYSGRRQNVGRVRISQKLGRTRHFRSPMQGNANDDALPFNLDRHVLPGQVQATGRGAKPRISGTSALDGNRIE